MDDWEFFLNVRVARTKKVVQTLLDQLVYIHIKVLDMFSVNIGAPHTTRNCPLPSDAVDSIAKAHDEFTEQQQMYVDTFPCRSLLGVLLYLSMNTKPDFAYAVGVRLRIGANPILPTYKLTLYLLQYV